MMDDDKNKNLYKDRVTIYEVAKVAGVSLATVSRVINMDKDDTHKAIHVRPETEKKVKDAINKLGYKPSALAQGLASSKSTNIGIMIPSTGYVYIANMLDGMIDVAKIYGYISSIFITKRTKEDAAKVIENLIMSHVDGAVIFDDELGTDEINSIAKYHIPLIAIGKDITGEALGSIQLEYKDPVMDVVKEHLLAGNDDVTILNVVNDGKISDDIRDGLLEFGKANGKNIKLFDTNDSYAIVYGAMKEYFKTHKKGYFVAPRDSLAAAVVNAAHEANLRIPEDVQVLAEIGTKYSYIIRPEISSFSIDMFKVGSIAVRMLTKLMEDPNFLTNKTMRIRATYNKRKTTL
ncbi:MAG: LacI family transcriptional regulator [Bacilli bacterium]|jgi:LacI family transcriptional regulator|nr:LacI family transcriptional regulator [Bacilli bacterium]